MWVWPEGRQRNRVAIGQGCARGRGRSVGCGRHKSHLMWLRCAPHGQYLAMPLGGGSESPKGSGSGCWAPLNWGVRCPVRSGSVRVRRGRVRVQGKCDGGLGAGT